VGRDATAEDFLFALKRFAHPRTRAKGWWLFDGRIEGLDAWRKQLEEDIAARTAAGEPTDDLWGIERPVEGLYVRGDELHFELTTPYPQFLWVLAMNYTSVYPREAVEFYGDEYRNNPVGTGPFDLVEYNPVYRAVFERHEHYRDVRFPDPRNRAEDRWPGWEEDEAAGLLAHAGEPLPILDGMEIRFILEDQPRWLYFKAGYVDFLNPPKDNVAEAMPGGAVSELLDARGVRMDPWPELGTVYTAMNTEDSLLSNPDVRRAIAVATDNDWTVEHMYGGQAVVATSVIPPGVAGHDPDHHPYVQPDGKPDYERGRQLLARAGYPDAKDPATGRSLRLRYEQSGSGLTQRHFARRFSDSMRRIGIEVDPIVNTFPQMVEKMRNKQFQVAGLAWGFDYPDAQNILQLMYGPNKSPGINNSNFDDPEFNRLYEESLALEDSPERTALYERMAHIVSEQVPWVTRTHRIRPALQHQWLEGFKYTEVNYQFWRYASVDVEKRRALVSEWNRPVRWPLILLGLIFAGLVTATVAARRPTR